MEDTLFNLEFSSKVELHDQINIGASCVYHTTTQSELNFVDLNSIKKYPFIFATLCDVK